MRLISKIIGNQEKPVSGDGGIVDPITTNPNLLDNPWFTVNQREASGTISGTVGYFIDRWIKRYDGSVTINNDGTLTLDGTSDLSQIMQPFESDLYNRLLGNEVTLSVLFSDDTIFSATYSLTTRSEYYTYIPNKATSAICIDMRENSYKVYVIANGATLSVKAIKLEIGSVSTLHLDTAPNYSIELAKCQTSTADSSDTYANRGRIAVTKTFDTITDSSDPYYFAKAHEAWNNMTEEVATQIITSSNSYKFFAIMQKKNYFGNILTIQPVGIVIYETKNSGADWFVHTINFQSQ